MKAVDTPALSGKLVHSICSAEVRFDAALPLNESVFQGIHPWSVPDSVRCNDVDDHENGVYRCDDNASYSGYTTTVDTPVRSGNSENSICLAEARQDAAPVLSHRNLQNFSLSVRVDDAVTGNCTGNTESVDTPALSGNLMHIICPAVARHDAAPRLNSNAFQAPRRVPVPNGPLPRVGVAHDLGDSLRVYYQNVRSLRSRADDIFTAVCDAEHDIIVLTETWLNDHFYSAQFFYDNYNVYRKYRCTISTGKSRGGGVLIAVASRLNSAIAPMVIDDHIEHLWVILECSNRRIWIGVTYLPPDMSSDVSVIERHLPAVNTVTSAMRFGDVHILLGDYNQRLLGWKKTTSGAVHLDMENISFTTASSKLVDGMFLNTMRQLNTVTNFQGRTLDLLFLFFYLFNLFI